MSLYNYFILIDVQYDAMPTLMVPFQKTVQDNFLRILGFIQECKYWQSLEKTIFVYAHNYSTNLNDVAILQDEVDAYNNDNHIPKDRKVIVTHCNNLDALGKLYLSHPPRRNFILGGNMTGCMINPSLNFNYFDIKKLNDNTYIVPELCYDQGAHSIIHIMDVYLNRGIKVMSLDTLKYYLFEQSIRNNGFYFTKKENDFDIFIENQTLLSKRERGNKF